MTKLSDAFLYMDLSWQKLLAPELAKPYFQKLEAFLEEPSGAPIYPPSPLWFHAFATTPFEKVSVVIIGQDPYHGPGQAHGLSFSVPPGVPAPPSLKNIFKELKTDLQIEPPPHGCLLKWAEQGVFLLNATLTVQEGQPAAHHGKGWETFTDRVVELLCLQKRPIVFMLWGNTALKKFQHIKACAEGHHLALTAAHPSPLSAYAGFFGCKHFSKANAFLKVRGEKPIDWARF
jgi:uracil-DNA glycosylase